VNVRRVFVPRPAPRRNLAAFLVVWGAVAASAAPPGKLEPHTFARAYEPGEVVRFEVDTDAAVVALRGQFMGAAASFVRASGDTAGESWVGWAVIPLDAPAGSASYRLSASRPDGSTQTASGALEILSKSFPEQRLTVESKFVNPPKAASARIAREQKRLAAIYARRTPLRPAATPFVKPVRGDPTSEFGTRRFFNGVPRAPHPGIDLHAASGTPVLAAGPGRIALAADLYYSGGTVIVDHGGGLFTVYAHLSKIEAKEGADVAAGDRVGLSGATGRVTGPHLHWGARVGESIFDPRGLLDPQLFGLTAGARP